MHMYYAVVAIMRYVVVKCKRHVQKCMLKLA